MSTFAEATTIQTLSENTYSADFPREWCIGTGTNLNIFYTQLAHMVTFICT